MLSLVNEMKFTKKNWHSLRFKSIHMHHFVEVLIFRSTHNWRLVGSKEKKTPKNNEPKRNLTLVCITFVGSPKHSGGSVVQFHCDARGERQVEPLSRSHLHGERAPDQWECYTSVYVYELTWAAEGHADKESESRLFKVISKGIRNKNISKESSRAGARSLISGGPFGHQDDATQAA